MEIGANSFSREKFAKNVFVGVSCISVFAKQFQRLIHKVICGNIFSLYDTGLRKKNRSGKTGNH